MLVAAKEWEGRQDELEDRIGSPDIDDITVPSVVTKNADGILQPHEKPCAGDEIENFAGTSGYVDVVNFNFRKLTNLNFFYSKIINAFLTFSDSLSD